MFLFESHGHRETRIQKHNSGLPHGWGEGTYSRQHPRLSVTAEIISQEPQLGINSKQLHTGILTRILASKSNILILLSKWNLEPSIKLWILKRKNLKFWNPWNSSLQSNIPTIQERSQERSWDSQQVNNCSNQKGKIPLMSPVLNMKPSATMQRCKTISQESS